MSYGFHAHQSFKVVGAADVEVGKPSTGHGAIGCNATYEKNVGVAPAHVDLSSVTPDDLMTRIQPGFSDGIRVLLACPPCTGFSRAVARNWMQDDPRNSLVVRVADFAALIQPDVIIMENVPQLIIGSFRQHFQMLRTGLAQLGYQMHASTHTLSRFGLPQQRERALIVAVNKSIQLRTLEDLWKGFALSYESTTVRRAIHHLPAIAAGDTDKRDPNHTSTLLTGESLSRIQSIPHDGGSWLDLLGEPKTERYLIPSMWKAVKAGRLNAYCDVYGRMSWDKPAPTIKRECSHVGNGRYCHPEQDRQCTVREMAILQGFPQDYSFIGTSRKNLYRQIGDAVPPLISYQLACLVDWMLTGSRPEMESLLLPGTSLRPSDLRRTDDSYTQLVLA